MASCIPCDGVRTDAFAPSRSPSCSLPPLRAPPHVRRSRASPPPLLVAACGQAPQGGFHGFPPAAVTTLVLQPRDPAGHLRIRRADGGLEGSRGARAGHGHPREAPLHRRRMGEGRPAAVPHRSEAAEAQAAAAEAEVARARAQLAQVRARSRAAEAARGKARGRAEGSRRRRVERGARARGAESRRGAAGRSQSQSRLHARSTRRSPACRAAPTSPKEASSPPTTRC